MSSNVAQDFYLRDVETVARELLGCVLVNTVNGVSTSGTIIETEAYHEREPASHTHRGLTARNKAMFGPPGHAYVYLSYGIHWCFNVTTEPQGVGAGVLIRALKPVSGIESMKQRRGQVDEVNLVNGPGKLTQALGITNKDYGKPLYAGNLRITQPPQTIFAKDINSGPRVGISQAKDKPWRFWLDT